MKPITYVALAGSALVAASGAASASTRAYGTSASGCRLQVGYAGSTVGSGNVFAYFRITNRGDHSCGPGAYPSVRLFGAAGRSIATKQVNRDPFGFVRHAIDHLGPGQAGHFYLIFRPLTPSGAHRCTPIARAATVRWAGGNDAHIGLTTHGSKGRVPINPCHGEITVTRVATGA